MQIVLFARDDSSHPNYASESYHRFDVVDILPDGVELGKEVTLPTFYVVDCDATMEELQHLKEPLLALPAADYRELRRRKHSLDGLPAPYYANLIATGRASIPLGVLIANQRIKT